MALSLSSKGVAALQKEEGFSAETYFDSAGMDGRMSEVFFGPRYLALALGFSFYCNGTPCKSGHDGCVRAAMKSSCTQCGILRAGAWKKANPKKVYQSHTRYYAKNKDKILAYGKEWVAKNPEKVAAKTKRYSQTERRALQTKSANKKRRAASRRAMPSWLTRDERACMEQMYQQRRALEGKGEKMHVDHIVPLRGKAVCGLHVPWNLRLIPAAENLKKGNKLEESSV